MGCGEGYIRELIGNKVLLFGARANVSHGATSGLYIDRSGKSAIMDLPVTY